MKKLTYSSLAAVLWGLWIINPMWNSFVVSQAYSVMALIAPEELWGGFVLAIGVFGMFANLTGRVRLQLISGVLLMAVWTTLTITFAFGALSSTASINYVVAGLLAIGGYSDALTQYLRGRQ